MLRLLSLLLLLLLLLLLMLLLLMLLLVLTPFPRWHLFSLRSAQILPWTTGSSASRCSTLSSTWVGCVAAGMCCARA